MDASLNPFLLLSVVGELGRKPEKDLPSWRVQTDSVYDTVAPTIRTFTQLQPPVLYG